MEIITQAEIKVFANPGYVSEQLLSPHNSTSSRVTITRVTVEPGAVNGRHKHATSEQIWIAIAGSGVLLVADGAEVPFRAGQVARFADEDTHGFRNGSSEPFVYISVTSPPIDFAPAYREHR